VDQSPWSRKVPPAPPRGMPESRPQASPSASPSPTGPPSRPGGVSADPNLYEDTTSTEPARRNPLRPSKRRFNFKTPIIGVLAFMIAGFGVGLILLKTSDKSEQKIAPIASESSVVIVEGTTTSVSAGTAGLANWDALSRSVVYIEASSPCDWRGSGTLVLDGSYILTNQHVASTGDCELSIGLTKGLSTSPVVSLRAVVLVYDEVLDLAVLRLIDDAGTPFVPAGHKPVTIDYSQPALGSSLSTLGYPALGSFDAGMTVTYTSGNFSGMDYTDGEYYKTDAQMRGGVSGGAAFNAKGLFIGVPSAGFIEENTGNPVGINLIRPAKLAKSLLEQAQNTR